MLAQGQSIRQSHAAHYQPWHGGPDFLLKLESRHLRGFIRRIFSSRRLEILFKHEFPQDVCQTKNGEPKKFCWRQFRKVVRGLCVCMHGVCVHACTCTCIYVCMVCMHVCVCECMCVCMHGVCVYVYMSVCMYA